MTPNEYQFLAERTVCDYHKIEDDGIFEQSRQGELYYDGDACVIGLRLLHAMIGISSEAGEICSAMKSWIFYRQPRNDDNIVEELGDCLWYIAEACNALGISMEAVMEANIAKLQKRYPEKYKEELAVEENRRREEEMKEVKRVLIEDAHTVCYPDVVVTPVPKCTRPNVVVDKVYLCPSCGYLVNDSIIARMIVNENPDKDYGCPECLQSYTLETLVCRN